MKVSPFSGNPYIRGELSTVDLLVLTGLDELLNIIYLFTKLTIVVKNLSDRIKPFDCIFFILDISCVSYNI
jgi:hypothetical protein